MSIQKMPYPSYIKDGRVAKSTGLLISGLATFTFFVILCVEATFPTNEKYIGINVSMKDIKRNC